LEYYQDIFGNEFRHGQIIPLGNTPSGKTEMCEAYFFGQKYFFMETEIEHHPLNDAMSLMLYCEDQQEIDKYWDNICKEGTAVQCGWCIDKFGLRWQILPKNLPELMSRPHAFEVMMKQTKIVIAAY
jgi:predicted 3-demethylubiquinone-9 3-methyltransferase (glyoxalase superfamily)